MRGVRLTAFNGAIRLERQGALQIFDDMAVRRALAISARHRDSARRSCSHRAKPVRSVLIIVGYMKRGAYQLDAKSRDETEQSNRAARVPTVPFSKCLLTIRDAALRLGVSPSTLYDWLSKSDYGLFVLRGQRVDIRYFQGGRRGQGRIRIEAEEVERVLELMRVQPQSLPERRAPLRKHTLPGIYVKLGRPA